MTQATCCDVEALDNPELHAAGVDFDDADDCVPLVVRKHDVRRRAVVFPPLVDRSQKRKRNRRRKASSCCAPLPGPWRTEEQCGFLAFQSRIQHCRRRREEVPNRLKPVFDPLLFVYVCELCTARCPPSGCSQTAATMSALTSGGRRCSPCRACPCRSRPRAAPCLPS